MEEVTECGGFSAFTGCPRAAAAEDSDEDVVHGEPPPEYARRQSGQDARKWWHVPDEQVDKLVKNMWREGYGGSSSSSAAAAPSAMKGRRAAATGGQGGLSASASAPALPGAGGGNTERRIPGTMLGHAPGSEKFATASASGVSSPSASKNASPQAAKALGGGRSMQHAVAAMAARLGRKEKESDAVEDPFSRRRVRFDGAVGQEEEDALDAMLRRTLRESGSMQGFRAAGGDAALDEAAHGGEDHTAAANKQKTKDWWKVTDEELERQILEMAAKNETEGEKRRSSTGPFGQSAAGTGLGLQRTGKAASAPTLPGKGKQGQDERIVVNIFFVDSGDTLQIKVPPDLRVGPASAPSSNRFTDIFGLGASTKGFDQAKKSFDYNRRQFGTTQRPGWRPEYTENLKDIINRITELEVDKMQLSAFNNPVTQDQLTLRSYGIKTGGTVCVTVKKWEPGQHSLQDVSLAHSTKKKRETTNAWEKRRDPDYASKHHGSGYSLRNSKHLKDCKHDGDMWMMPRWIAQSSPGLFAPVGIGITGDGAMKVRKDFSEEPIWLPDGLDTKLGRVRQRVTGHLAYTGPYNKGGQ
eukprot:TRINITY_DN26546_c0_g1_i1.p1 TRINITY_DN26546_c0_g1~~TRINITY_DN26546_c0_g1_i1.p1  ORF type:complete len:583 (+),score=169.44 TRINITY_DN26546_c0_g1_i1:161-1909(+)